MAAVQLAQLTEMLVKALWRDAPLTPEEARGRTKAALAALATGELAPPPAPDDDEAAAAEVGELLAETLAMSHGGGLPPPAAEKLASARRRLLASGTPGSGMAAFRHKARLLRFFLAMVNEGRSHGEGTVAVSAAAATPGTRMMSSTPLRADGPGAPASPAAAPQRSDVSGLVRDLGGLGLGSLPSLAGAGALSSGPPAPRPAPVAASATPTRGGAATTTVAPTPLTASREALRAAHVSSSSPLELDFLPPAAEATLVREALYALQGLAGGAAVAWDEGAQVYTCAKGSGASASGLDLAPGVRLPAPAAAAVAAVGEAGWLYRRLQAALAAEAEAATAAAAASSSDPAPSPTFPPSAVRRAFFSGLRCELDQYWRLLAGLEAEVAADATTGAAGGTARWTLRRLALWATEPTRRLTLLARLVDAVGSPASPAGTGGPLLSALHSHWMDGDASVKALVGRLLARACAPLMDGLRAWILGGDAPGTAPGTAPPSQVDAASAPGPDPTNADAFILASRDVPVHGLWSSKFSCLQARVPAFLASEHVDALCATGRAVYCVRALCGDGEWVLATTRGVVAALEEEAAGALHAEATARGGDPLAALTAATGAPALADVRAAVAALRAPHAAARASAIAGSDPTGARALSALVSVLRPLAERRLVWLLLGRGSLHAHLQALHRYVLLAQGDFVSNLLASVAPHLEGSAAAVAGALPALDGALEAAFRSSNAGALDKRDHLDRLAVRLLRPGPGDAGWDVFTLEYTVDGPSAAIVTPGCLASYARLFSFLWRVKRVEHALSGTWGLHMTASHRLRSLRHAGLARTLHMCHVLRSHMSAFLGTLHNYLMFEGLASAWGAFEEGLRGLWGALRTGRPLPSDGTAAIVTPGSDAGVSVDALLGSHAAYLSRMLDKCFLSRRTSAIGAALATAMGECLRFSALQAQLVEAALDKAGELAAHEAAVAAATAAGAWTDDLARSDEIREGIATSLSREVLAAFSPHLRGVSDAYSAAVGATLAAMSAAAATGEEGLEDLQLLLFRLDYNGFYRVAADVTPGPAFAGM